jgi:hypothetical protein
VPARPESAPAAPMSRTTNKDERARRTALADEVKAEIEQALARGRVVAIRRRSTNAVSDWLAWLLYAAVIGGLLLFAVGADKVSSDRKDTVADAKACGEARKAGAAWRSSRRGVRDGGRVLPDHSFAHMSLLPTSMIDLRGLGEVPGYFQLLLTWPCRTKYLQIGHLSRRGMESSYRRAAGRRIVAFEAKGDSGRDADAACEPRHARALTRRAVEAVPRGRARTSGLVLVRRFGRRLWNSAACGARRTSRIPRQARPARIDRALGRRRPNGASVPKVAVELGAEAHRASAGRAAARCFSESGRRPRRARQCQRMRAPASKRPTRRRISRRSAGQLRRCLRQAEPVRCCSRSRVALRVETLRL